MKAEPKIKNLHGTVELEDQPHLTPSLPPPRRPPKPQMLVLVSKNCVLANAQKSLSGEKVKWDKTFWTGVATSYAIGPLLKLWNSLAVGKGRLAYSVVTGPCTNPDLGDWKK